MKSLSIVINTYNRCAFLERALLALQYLRYPELEVVCVNGPSYDGTAELLARWDERIKQTTCPEANLSLSRNIGIQAASGDIICFMDDDAIPEPNWLDMLVTAFERPEVAAAGGFIRDHTGVNYQARYVVCDRFSDAFGFDRREDIKLKGRGPGEWGTDYYTALTGTNSAFRRDILVQIGGFDEVFAYFLDETDVLMRLVDAGYELVCLEGAEIHHKYAPSHLRDDKKIPKSLYYPMRSRSYFAWRHALERNGLALVNARVQRHVDAAKAVVVWHATQGNIDAAHREILLSEIDKGARDGFNLAFSLQTPCVRQASFFTAAQVFKPFPCLLPAEKRLRLCFISQDYPPRPNGGIGVWMSELVRGLAERGHEISVITRTDEKFDTVDFEEGVWVHRIVQRHFPERPYAAPADLPQLIYDWSASAYAELRRIMLIRSLDLTAAPIWDVEGVVTHCEGKIPVLLTLHTTYALALPSKPLWREMPGYLDGHVRPVIKAEKMLWEQAPVVIANSEAIVRDLSTCYDSTIEAERLALIPHGLKDQYSKQIQDGATGSSETCRILFVGRFEERKGIDVLLSCIPDIVTKHLEVSFELIGANNISGFWTDFQKKYRSEAWFSRISAPGFVSPNELAAAYNVCDIFVAPSRYESFGLIYLEAMMCGKPCIGTNVGGIPEVVEDKISGLIVNPGDSIELARALCRLIEEPELRQRFGQASRVIYERKFTDKIMVSGLETVFYKTMES